MTRTVATLVTIVMGGLILLAHPRSRSLRSRLKPYTVDGDADKVAAWLEEIAGPRS